MRTRYSATNITYCNRDCHGRSIGSNLAKFSAVVNAQRSVIVQQFFRNVMLIADFGRALALLLM